MHEDSHAYTQSLISVHPKRKGHIHIKYKLVSGERSFDAALFYFSFSSDNWTISALFARNLDNHLDQSLHLLSLNLYLILRGKEI